jgi:hypothetical protein
MLTWGFEAEAARLAARARRRSKRNVRDSSSSSSSSSSGMDSGSISTSDEEYQKIIAGEEDDDDDKMKELMERFEMTDKDKSGGLTMTEFVNLGMAEQMPRSDHHNFGEVHGGGVGGGANLSDRMDKLEAKIDSANKKLDDVLFMLRKRC